MFDFKPNFTHIGVPKTARESLLAMVTELVDTSGLVSIYIPESTEDVWNANSARGRVVGAVRLIDMPSDRAIDDYFYDDWDRTRRWPIGWPWQVIYAPPVLECPRLRDHVEFLFKSGNFGPYVSRFQNGPFRLEPDMREQLNRDFAEFVPLI